jgi:pimeloyl-ACP methyl ester carboxylesterase
MTRIALDTGVALNVQEFGSGSPAVVFLHGGAMTHRVWDHQAAAVMRSHRSIAVDLRGAGASDKPPSGYSVDLFAEDVGALVGALEVERPVIVGHGLGAYVALRGRRRPPRRASRDRRAGSHRPRPARPQNAL